MHTDTTQKEKPTGDGNPTAGHTDPHTVTKQESPDKEFSNFRAAYAMRGYCLYRTNPDDGAVSYWVERWGLARDLPTIDEVRRFLESIGGRM